MTRRIKKSLLKRLPRRSRDLSRYLDAIFPLPDWNVWFRYEKGRDRYWVDIKRGGTKTGIYLDGRSQLPFTSVLRRVRAMWFEHASR